MGRMGGLGEFRGIGGLGVFSAGLIPTIVHTLIDSLMTFFQYFLFNRIRVRVIKNDS